MQHFFNMLGASVVLFTDVNLGHDLDDVFNTLINETPWEQRSINIAGKTIPQPRLVAWYGNDSYTYSGLRLEPRPLPPLLADMAQKISWLTGADYNGVLLNLYKDGQSSIGMHADDEPEFGINPTIASLSLGASRIFDLERKDKSFPRVQIPLTHESVLVMGGQTQSYWKHGVAKTKEPVGPRINLTFRNIVNHR